MPVNSKRIRTLKKSDTNRGPVVLWMSRDQRVHDNWSLLLAQELSIEQKSPLVVVFCLVPQFLNATTRQYGFMLEGLQEVEKNLAKKNIPFFLLIGSPAKEILKFIKKHRVSTLVKDFDPLRIKRGWADSVALDIDVPFYEVDAHNVVPCWMASPKQEFGAYTLRPKIRILLPEFLEEYPPLKKHPFSWEGEIVRPHWGQSLSTLKVENIPEVEWIKPGERAAFKVLNNFLEKKLSSYDKERNDPTKNGQSNLSPYLHFGQISAQRIALEVLKTNIDSAPAALFVKRGIERGGVSEQSAENDFLEELIVRGELSDNFCFYNTNYDNFDGFPEWAKKTLNEHRKDKRKYLYAPDEFERAETHDDLWNAAQMEMVRRGKMHGYMRMYWAKKILEWTESPEKAMEVAFYLNDRYELDGRDPNGCAGIAWSIGGVHDRAWNERPLFGKIRYMSYNGCKAKFDVKKYIDYVQDLG